MATTLNSILALLQKIDSRMETLESRVGALEGKGVESSEGSVGVVVGGLKKNAAGDDAVSVSTESRPHGSVGGSTSWSDEVEEAAAVSRVVTVVSDDGNEAVEEAKEGTGGGVAPTSGEVVDKVEVKSGEDGVSVGDQTDTQKPVSDEVQSGGGVKMFGVNTVVEVKVPVGISNRVRERVRFGEFDCEVDSQSDDEEDASDHGDRKEEPCEEEGGPVVEPVEVAQGPVKSATAPVVADGESLFRTYVKNERVLALREWLRERAGVMIPKSMMYELAVATYAAGAMPDFFREGRNNLGSLAMVGDAALTLAVVKMCRRRGYSTAEASNTRTAITSNARLCRALLETRLGEYIVAVPGHDVFMSKTGATALEAIIGVVALTGDGDKAVARFLRALRLVL